MSRTQRIRRLFLLFLIFWGVAGGLVSLHTCLDSPKNKMATSCCCESNHVSKIENESTDCCKTLTSYVGIPLYFIDGKQALCFSDCFQLDFSILETIVQSQIAPFNITIHPPPENHFSSGSGKRILAMRI